MQQTLRESDRARDEEARRDRERLQGDWRSVSDRREAELTITGDAFVMAFRSGESYEGIFHLDPTCRPREIDLRITDGPAEHRGLGALAIYQIDGDHLIWATGRPGTGERPGSFPHEGDPGQLCLIFRRAGA